MSIRLEMEPASAGDVKIVADICWNFQPTGQAPVEQVVRTGKVFETQDVVGAVLAFWPITATG
jgi:hypothetical protein